MPVNYLDTFKAPEPGYLGGLFNNEPFYYYTPSTPKCESLFHYGGFERIIA